jgi:hypothetical protein
MDTQQSPESLPVDKPQTQIAEKIEAQTDQSIQIETVNLTSQRQAQLITLPSGGSGADAVSALGLKQPEALMLLLGGIEGLPPGIGPRLVQLFSRGIARALVNIDALVFDSGLSTGTSQMLGQGVADRGFQTPVVGVAPAQLVAVPGSPKPEAVALDSNHSHFVLTPGSNWGDETETLFEMAETLAPERAPVVLLIGGGDVAKKQMLQAVRQGWPVIILKESGGLADTVAALAQERPHFIEDSGLAEIIVDGKLYYIQSTGPISSFERVLEQLLSRHEHGTALTTLELVWQRFAQYDEHANQQQRNFNRIQLAILVLGVVATFLAITHRLFKFYIPDYFGEEALTANSALWVTDWGLYIVLLLLPISVSVLISAANRFSSGNKWIFLRASAESLKKEIYRYRTRVDLYSDLETRRVSREMKLHRKEEAISRKLMQTEVNLSALSTYSGPIPPRYGAGEGDDGLSFLTPNRYLKYRLEDQLTYYQSKTVKIEKQMKRLQWLIYIFGGVGTLMVAIGFEIWLAFTTSLVTAISTFLEYKQLETTLMRYNQTAAELTSLRSWWIALSAEEQADPLNIDKLVNQTETSIHSEHAAWVQEMQDTMAELRAAQTDEKSGNKSEPAAESKKPKPESGEAGASDPEPEPKAESEPEQKATGGQPEKSEK